MTYKRVLIIIFACTIPLVLFFSSVQAYNFVKLRSEVRQMEARQKEWVEKNKIPFPVGMIKGDEEKTRFTWGVRPLPWLILTDKKHIVTAEGFNLDELDEKTMALVEK